MVNILFFFFLSEWYENLSVCKNHWFISRLVFPVELTLVNTCLCRKSWGKMNLSEQDTSVRLKKNKCLAMDHCAPRGTVYMVDPFSGLPPLYIMPEQQTGHVMKWHTHIHTRSLATLSINTHKSLSREAWHVRQTDCLTKAVLVKFYLTPATVKDFGFPWVCLFIYRGLAGAHVQYYCTSTATTTSIYSTLQRSWHPHSFIFRFMGQNYYCMSVKLSGHWHIKQI